ncbi:GatB/YqeY domain-containing protein [Exidia glandulosa HHB12029]|uniref:Altered inheritance of mitochondria protein 41 n=1 Tax=Exidia glandulosa HHB12029 TaxID=1314781 RepID=A0A166MYM0_EXIGL|nr:GatB/YqeY domain-containing protein [Exidia glandulosa HHB12029]
MFSVLRSQTRLVTRHTRRFVSTDAPVDVRVRLQKELLQARKARDAFKTNVLRSAVAEIDSKDKTATTPPTPEGGITLLRKLIALRREASESYANGGAEDRADAERQEADYLATFLPTQKTEAEIDEILQQLISAQPTVPADKAAMGRFTGTIIKAFRDSVDVNTVQMDVVAKRLQALLAQKASSSS